MAPAFLVDNDLPSAVVPETGSQQPSSEHAGKAAVQKREGGPTGWLPHREIPASTPTPTLHPSPVLNGSVSVNVWVQVTQTSLGLCQRCPDWLNPPWPLWKPADWPGAVHMRTQLRSSHWRGRPQAGPLKRNCKLTERSAQQINKHGPVCVRVIVATEEQFGEQLVAQRNVVRVAECQVPSSLKNYLGGPKKGL